MINKAINFFAANPRADIEIVRGIKASGGRLTMPQEELESMSPIFRPRISNELVPHSTYDAAARVESPVSLPPIPMADGIATRRIMCGVVVVFGVVAV